MTAAIGVITGILFLVGWVGGVATWFYLGREKGDCPLFYARPFRGEMRIP